MAEAREARFPFSLNTGRLRDQWHGMSRTGSLGRLFGHVPEPVVQMNAQDMARRQLAEGELVQVKSKRGAIVLPVQASREVGMSQAFIAMHWGPEYLSGRAEDGSALAGVNALTTSAFCPDSKQPELKHAVVRIEKAPLGWTLLAAAWLPEDDVLAVREALRRLMSEFPFASCVPFGTGGALTPGSGTVERNGVLFRAAAPTAPDESLVTRIEQLLALASADTLHYADKRHGQRRAMRLVRQGGTRQGGDAAGLPAWPGTRARRPGSRRCCRTSCRRRPTGASCSRRAPPRPAG